MIKIEAIPLDQVRYKPDDPDAPIEVRATIKRSELPKFDAWIIGDAWEKAQAAREAKLEECTKSITVLLDTARRHMGTTGGRVCATVLASLYNGDRVKFDLTDLKSLDDTLYEHAMNTIRLCVETMTEPHQYFKNGGQIFEQLIADWGLEKKRRARK